MSLGESTLRNWRDNLYPERYWELQRDVLPKIRAQAAEKHSELADIEGELNRKLLARLDAEHKDIPARDLSTAVRNLDVGQGIHRTKAAELRGENPGAPTPGRNVSDILRALRGKAPHLFENGRLTLEWRRSEPEPDAIEGTAEEQA